LSAELHALKQASRTLLEQKGFAETARRIFDLCLDLIGATSGYVALLSDDGSENEVLFLEAGGLPCNVDPELPMPIRGLRATAYHENRVAYDNDFMNSEWVKYMPAGHVVLRNVMFSPLVIDGRTVGLMGMANKPKDFTEDDARIAGSFGELAAVALRNSREVDRREQAEAEREATITELREALDKVKQLSRLLPICCICKKIRDDTGYWEQVEGYISRHAGVVFSHGICPECLEQHYPDHAQDD
jgi:GAF domain-containing protein